MDGGREGGKNGGREGDVEGGREGEVQGGTQPRREEYWNGEEGLCWLEWRYKDRQCEGEVRMEGEKEKCEREV